MKKLSIGQREADIFFQFLAALGDTKVEPSKCGYLQTLLGHIRSRAQYADAAEQIGVPTIAKIAKEKLAVYDENPDAYKNYTHSLGIY